MHLRGVATPMISANKPYHHHISCKYIHINVHCTYISDDYFKEVSKVPITPLDNYHPLDYNH